MRLIRVALGTVALGFVFVGITSAADEPRGDSLGPMSCEAYANYAGREPDWYADQCIGDVAPVAEPVGPVRVPGDTAHVVNVRGADFRSHLLPTLTYTIIGPQALPLFATDYNVAATQLWAIDNNAPHNYGTINTATGVFTTVGQVTGAILPATALTGMKFDPLNGLVYVSSATQLFTLDMTTGVSALVGTYSCIGAGLIIDIAISNTGQMYGNEIALDQLVRIDKTNATCVVVGPTGVATNFAQGMDFDWSDNTLYAWMYTGGGGNRLSTVNLTTGAATTVATGVNEENEGSIRVALGGPLPTLNIADSSVVEGNTGTSPATLQGFTVSLSASSASQVTVNFATAPGTATAPADYIAATGTLTFAPGQTSQSVTVSVVGDLVDESNENYFVNLSAPSGATIGDGQGEGTIVDDDGPTINAGDAQRLEGNSGTADLLMPVTLSAPSPGVVTVAFATADGSATAPSDYTATSGVLTFAPGTTALAVTVSINGDVTPEPDENFFVNLSAPTGGTIGDGQGVGTIQNDDGAAGGDTTGELSHKFKVNGDLASGPNDTDDYAIQQNPFSSYEVVVDGASGDISPVVLERRAGTTVIQTALPIGTGTGRSLRWANDTSNVVITENVRVASGGCTTDCGADDVYRLRSYETTYAIPRFNNSGTQITILLLQNPTDYNVNARVYFWDAAGNQLHAEPVTVNAKSLLIFNTATIPAVNGQSGAVTLTHDGRFGDLAGKTVALEPATGFSFDSPMLTR